jgi:hypothetical protein
MTGAAILHGEAWNCLAWIGPGVRVSPSRRAALWRRDKRQGSYRFRSTCSGVRWNKGAETTST